MWQRVVLLGVLSFVLGGCPDRFTRERGTAPVATPDLSEPVRPTDDLPTPSLLRFNLGIPSE
jgi:hypothetical protein